MNEQELENLRAVYGKWSTERLGEVLDHRARYTGEAVGVALDILRGRELPAALQQLAQAVAEERDRAQAATPPAGQQTARALHLLTGAFGMASALAGAVSSVVLFCWAWSHLGRHNRDDTPIGVVMMAGALAILWTAFSFFRWSLRSFRGVKRRPN